MIYEFRLPDLGEGVVEAEIVRWLVGVGDAIDEDDLLVEVQTDKTTVEIPSPVSGSVIELRTREGEVVPVGGTLVAIEIRDGEHVAVSSPVTAPREAGERMPVGRAAPTAERRVQATPLVRRKAAALGIDLSSVSGSGLRGRITEADLAAVLAAKDPTKPPASRGGRPLRGVRKVIAQHLEASHRDVPAVTVVEECDFTEVGAVRGELSYLPFVLAATVGALQAHPHINATFDGETITVHDRIDIGVAVQTDRGLVVPVLRGAERMVPSELDRVLRGLSEAARADSLAASELRGSTFTISSAGRLGGLFATPLVNAPEIAILGFHRVSPRPVVRDGGIHVRDIGFLACTFDHRVLDGVDASAFLLDLITRLEQPSALLERTA